MILTALLGLLVIGSGVYCLLACVAVANYVGVRRPESALLPPFSILKPLSGPEPELEEHLRSYFTLDYPEFELLFAVRTEADPAVPIVRRLIENYPLIPAQLLLTGEPPYANAKVFSLDSMLRASRHPIVLMADSDVRAHPSLLRGLAREFADPHVALVTCPYRAIPEPPWWARLEALSINTEFFASVFTARMLGGMDFALGPAIAARRSLFEQVPFCDLKDFLAEDFVLGNRAAALGHKVVLSREVVDHYIGGGEWRANVRHRLRWNRSTRRSRPWGYVGQIFTNPLPLGLMLVVAQPRTLPLVVAVFLLRGLAALMTVQALELRFRSWGWLPVADLLSFGFWVSGFFGSIIEWRGRRYRVLKDGRFEPA
jgi:ceramide glucosyltransferase